MRALVLETFGGPFVPKDVPTPVIAPHEALVRVRNVGVCGTDVKIRANRMGLGVIPLIMGHENVGEVVAVGPDARGINVGDRRIAFPWMGCGACAVCRREEEQLCTTPRFLGVFRAGGYSDHLMMPHPRYLIDYGTIPAEQAAPLACSGVTTYGALKKLGQALIEREAVVIVGAGGLGLMCLSILKAMNGRGAIR